MASDGPSNTNTSHLIKDNAISISGLVALAEDLHGNWDFSLCQHADS